MSLPRQFTSDLAGCDDVLLAGGKGTSLGRLIRGGFPVPPGFVVNTRAYQLAREAAGSGAGPIELPPGVAEEILQAYRTMDAGTVAVRSSATAEDLAAASMAGQCESILDVTGEENLLVAVRRCWASLNAPHIQAYFDKHGIDSTKVAMAVVVQRLVPADVAGVLFTVNPNGFGRSSMLIEASWGLGEMVVGGRVQPDMFVVERETGRQISSVIGDKRIQLVAGTRTEHPVEDSLRKKACLSESDVHRLWELGTRIAGHFGVPQDIEWAIHGGNLYLLQSRPITTCEEIEAGEAVLNATQQHLRVEMAAGRGPWVLHNLAETLPHPTPLTWSVICKFMSGRGGFGAMYRQAGYQPAPVIDQEGFLELIAGRIYMDAARAPEIFSKNFPFAYDLERLKSDPDASQKPPTLPRGTYAARAEAAAQMSRAAARLKKTAAVLAEEFRKQTAPAVVEYVARATQVDLSAFTASEFMALWEERETQVLSTFGAATMMPGMICGLAWAELETFLQEYFWEEDAEGLLRIISAGGGPDRTVLADAELHEVATGKRSIETWLMDHGYRGPGEFELSAPRWREQPAQLAEMAARLVTGEPPLERHHCGAKAAQQKAAELRSRLSAAAAREFDRHLELVHRYMPFREDGKDLLMLGYGLLRELALEAGYRLGIGDGVFYLTREELFQALRTGAAPRELIDQRELNYRSEIRLSLPRVIDAGSLEKLGEAAEVRQSVGGFKALPISAGSTTGPVCILHSPTEAGELGRGYILVCPSTDPAWTPLFVNAAGLVLERGGALSHGAVVAREMSLPAVVLPDATQLFRNGEQITLDANQGRVRRALEAQDSVPVSDTADPDDIRVPHEMTPPPVGRRERRAGKVALASAGLWLIYLAGFFLLPKAYVCQPSLAALDALLWPLVRHLGKPATVAVTAASLGCLMMLMQKFATDNHRLREAKRRAARLIKAARLLPEQSPRRRALTQLAAPVDFRVLVAAMVPVGLSLGVLVVSFAWFKDRMDPSVPAGVAGSPFQIVATVQSDWNQPVRIQVPAPLSLDESTPSSRTLPPIKKTLERLLALNRQSHSQTNLPWELQLVPELAQAETAASLQRYLEAGVPPQGVTWMIRPPAGTTGRFDLQVNAEGHPPVSLNVVLGEELPPGDLTVMGAANSPLQKLRVVFPPSTQKQAFWQPFRSLARHDHLPLVGKFAVIDVGWLWLYVFAYLPTLFLSKAALRIA